MSSNSDHYYSDDYATARKRFKEAASHSGADLHSLSITGETPDRQPLSIDIAWLGNKKPRRAILHSSGLHGVEGFAGSAAQLKILEAPPELAEDGALILVHTLNPYGMAWLRRTNENNVDLNRNFLPTNESWSGVTDAYIQLDPLLNPPTTPRFDFFYPRLIGKILRYGFQALKQALVCGQYEFEKGLFYGGKALQQEAQAYKTWLADNLKDIEHMLVIDAHTGLGKPGQESLFMDKSSSATDHSLLEKAMEKEIEIMQTTETGYTIRGGLSSLFNELFTAGKIDFMIQECGTVPPLKLLFALREENRWHHFGDSSIDHAAKQNMKAAFCPTSKQWRHQAITNGVNRIHLAAQFIMSRP